MDTIRIQNFRSFVDTGELSINKVNVLLGKNSSGKSSFLNLFPMFKESSKNELRSPFMWFNEGMYDFGSYSNAHCRFSDGKQPIIFEFGWRPLDKKIGPQCDDCGLFNRDRLGFLNDDHYKLIIRINSDSKGDYFENVSLQTSRHSISIECSKSSRSLSFYIDNALIEAKSAAWDYQAKGVLPDIKFKGRYSPVRSVRKLINSLIPDNPQTSLKNSDYEKLYSVPSIVPSEIYSYYESNRTNNPFMDYILKAHKKDSSEFKCLCNDISLSLIISSLIYADRYMTSTFEDTSYMLPVRYAFGRYIRNKNLAVDNIDSSGANVMEFLLSLNKKELSSFNALVNKVLGVTVSVETDAKNNLLGVNKSIMIDSKWGKDNIVDVGYGYTQILPIITVLWNLARQKKSCEFPNIVIIEQPEVHLHPSLQGDVAKLIVEAISLAKQNKSNMQVFVETHSEAFISKLGKYVRMNSNNDKEGISSEEVSLLLFEKHEGGTSITSTSFDKDGYIQRWPIGFLN